MIFRSRAAHPPRAGAGFRTRPQCEALEDRLTPAVHIKFDYTYDTGGFFNDPSRREALQRAADDVTARMTDSLQAITPGGANTWTAKIYDSASGQTIKIPNLTVNADEIVVYLTSGYLGGALAIASTPGFSASGSNEWFNQIRSRGEDIANGNDTSTWGGLIAFNTNYSFSADGTPTGNEFDLQSVATHELLHVFGFGMGGDSFNRYVQNGVFVGPNVVAVAGGPVAMQSDDHFATHAGINGKDSVITPSITRGQVKGMTDLEYAVLADMGWDQSPRPVSPPVATVPPVVPPPAPPAAVPPVVPPPAPPVAVPPVVPPPATSTVTIITNTTTTTTNNGVTTVNGVVVPPVVPPTVVPPAVVPPVIPPPPKVVVPPVIPPVVPPPPVVVVPPVIPPVVPPPPVVVVPPVVVPPPVAPPPVVVPPPVVPPAVSKTGRMFTIGSDAGGLPTYSAYDANGQLVSTGLAFSETFRGGVRTATADVNGDGVNDSIVAAGVGSAPHVRVFDGRTGLMTFNFFAFDATNRGGINVAAGDVNGDGKADLAVTLSTGQTRVFSGANGQLLAELTGQAVNDLAIGDVNGDGYGDLATTVGNKVSLWDGRSLATGNSTRLAADFIAFDSKFGGAATVELADIDGDGAADVIAGAGATNSPLARVFSGKSILANQPRQLSEFLAGDANYRTGVRLAAADMNNDGREDIIAIPAGVGSGSLKVFSGKSVATSNVPSVLRTMWNSDWAAYGTFVG